MTVLILVVVGAAVVAAEVIKAPIMQWSALVSIIS